MTIISKSLMHRTTYVWSIRAIQLAMILFAGASAFVLRFDFFVPSRMDVCLFWGCLVWGTVKPLTFHLFGLGRGVWRYFSTPDLVRVLSANLAGSTVAAVALIAVCPLYFPRSIFLIDLVVCVLLTVGVRAATRMLAEVMSRNDSQERKRTLIYGAGSSGVLLLREIRENSGMPYLITGFVDDDPDKTSMRVQGVRVLGRGADLSELVRINRVSLVIIAIPSATGSQMMRIVEHCQKASVVFRTMPALSEVIAGQGLTKQVRDVAVEDLLGRGSVQLDDSLISGKVAGKVVLVSGAAGSIGSELCRQIAHFRPAAMIAFDISESSLFALENELRELHPSLKLHAEIGNIQNVQRVREVFEEYRPALVLHAAAYKHVPLMERHLFEAVENNVFGTYNLAVAASDFGVGDFVMISSDKAVNPTNVMGATKRTAELVIRSLQNGGPRFVSVRFGNVLGSSGSVVPIFKRQIAAGGPVTVTHPDMRRYFMTIPEAAQLVLQACTMGRGGEIFVLDMGEPVNIVDLARQLIILSGFRPNEDIRIEFTGVRPGEKLYEELNLSNESLRPTHHAKIRIFAGTSPDNREMSISLARLRSACERRDAGGVILALKEAVPDYNTSKDILNYAFSANLNRLAGGIGRQEVFVRPTVGAPAVEPSV